MIRKKVNHKLTEFDYPLPKKYISQHPSPVRDQAKLMVLHQETGEIEHKKILSMRSASFFRYPDFFSGKISGNFPEKRDFQEFFKLVV